MSLDFVFDYRSPYAYLANTQLASLGVAVNYQVVNIINVMKKVNNQPSPMCPAKARYSGMDATRWAKLYQVAWAPNSVLMGALRDKSFDGSLLSRAALAAQELGVFSQIHDGIFAAIWASKGDLLTAQGRAQFLREHKAEADIWAHAESAQILELIEAADTAAAERGVFGVPTFYVGKDMFFGNDRLDFVRAALTELAE